MKLTIVRYTEKYRASWEQFVAHSINGTFLHSRAFYDHNSLNALSDCSYLYYKKNKIAAVIPGVLYEKDSKVYYNSHLRSTYGGFVVSNEIGVEEAVEMVQKLIEEAKKLNVDEIIIRNPFRIFNKDLCDETDYALWYNGFAVKAREVEIAVLLEGGIEQVRKKYENGAKYNIKKACALVNVAESNDYTTFWQMLDTNLMARYGKKPVHDIDSFTQLLNNIGRESVKLFGGYINNKLVCGVVVFVFDKVLHAQYIASDEVYQDARPVNAVIDYILKWGCDNSYKYFNLGTANEDGGKQINYGLFHFKEGFGGRGVLRETMSLRLNNKP